MGGSGKIDESQIFDDHSLWEIEFDKSMASKESSGLEVVLDEVNEKEDFEKNRREKLNRYRERHQTSDEVLKGNLIFTNLGESQNPIEWKKFLRRELEKEDTAWSRRHSVAENNFAYRLEDSEVDEDSETEVMLDISGSIEIDFIRAFLRQLKPLLECSKLRVGCFNGKFWGMKPIKSVRDIDRFSIPSEARGSAAGITNLDLAARSFSRKSKRCNKIVFTDGFASSGMMPKKDLMRENIIWLVCRTQEEFAMYYDYAPCCGKCIKVSKEAILEIQKKEYGKYEYEYEYEYEDY